MPDRALGAGINFGALSGAPRKQREGIAGALDTELPAEILDELERIFPPRVGGVRGGRGDPSATAVRALRRG